MLKSFIPASLLFLLLTALASASNECDFEENECGICWEPITYGYDDAVEVCTNQKCAIKYHRKCLGKLHVVPSFDIEAASREELTAKLREVVISETQTKRELCGCMNCCTPFENEATIWPAGMILLDRLLAQPHVRHTIDSRGPQFDQPTVLALAAREGNSRVVRRLLQTGASLWQQDSAGKTALIIAAKHDHADVVQQLLDAGASRDTQDYSRQTALDWAIRKGHDQVKRVLGYVPPKPRPAPQPRPPSNRSSSRSKPRPAPSSDSVEEQDSEPKVPFWRRWWFWTPFGVLILASGSFAAYMIWRRRKASAGEIAAETDVEDPAAAPSVGEQPGHPGGPPSPEGVLKSVI